MAAPITAQQLAARMKRRAAVVEREFRKTSNGVGIAAVKYTKELMTAQIYAIPEARTKSGEKKWRRTGHLRRSERFELADAYTVLVVNDAIYSAERHEAGKASSTILDHKPRNIDPLRESHWRDEMEQTFASILKDAYHATVLDILNAGQI